MQLSDIRTEVLNRGFDPSLFGSQRVTNFINDGYQLICQRVQFYTDEGSYDFSTVAGTAKYPLPAGWARLREMWDTSRNVPVHAVGLRDIDSGGLPPQGPPSYYALDGVNMHLWPTPDGIYPLELRYWVLPGPLVNDTDVPVIPANWHHLLVRFATAECYKCEDDLATGQAWEQDFEKYLALFEAEVKFPDSEIPDLAKSMWDTDRGLAYQKGWSVFGWG